MKQDIRKVKSIEDWIRYFSDNLGWEIDFDEIDDLDDITYDYEPEELGLKPESCAKIQSLRQLQPLTSDQPWGIFCIEFESKRFEITALRRILSSLIPRKCKYETEHKVWNLNDLLFICSWSDGNETTLGLAHFEERDGVLPQLRVIYCAPAKEDTHNITTFENRIGNLRWPEDTSDTEKWCNNWSEAFTSGYRETIHVAAELTQRLAEEALEIRDRILHTLEIETEQGYVHGLYTKFKEQLVHDMKEQDFADMYAQTIVYGLFSARCMDDTPETFSAAEAVDHIPNTNPFLKDLLKECLDVKTRSGISFDELEVGNVVDILARIDPKEIVEDFGRQTGGGREDPVLHFYEEFLNAYDKTQKVQRGVFYTPQPVVNFIVQAVDDILKDEFGLKDGLASTETKMVEMRVEKAQTGKSGLKTVTEKVEVPAVQVLDPATGTGTFLRQVILQIYENFRTAHKGESDASIRKAWNEYVPKNLLPRINGFELMMAPYAVAHMKLAMVLQETGYDFHSAKRLQVYLTNTLEEPDNSGAQMSLFSDPLAMESVEANKVKCNNGINIFLGNPPYSTESSNKGGWILDLMQSYKKEADGITKLKEKNSKPINDDYVKFICFCQHHISKTERGVVAFINPHGFTDGPIFRGMRSSMARAFDKIYILDLHGNANRQEISPDGTNDENVFDIKQGVCIWIGIKNNNHENNKLAPIFRSEIWGTRESKYKELNNKTLDNIVWQQLNPMPPMNLFIAENREVKNDYENGIHIRDLFPINGTGILTKRDNLCIQFTENDALNAAKDMIYEPKKYVIEKYSIPEDVRDWKYDWAVADVKNNGINIDKIQKITYRPFDIRFTYYTGQSRGFMGWPVHNISQHMLNTNNIALVTARSNKTGDPTHFFVSENIVEYKCGERTTNSSVFPLYKKNDTDFFKEDNFSEVEIKKFDKKTGLRYDKSNSDHDGIYNAFDLFSYLYGFLYSNKFRIKYKDLLGRDFPIIPYPKDKEFFWQVSDYGKELARYHLLKDIIVENLDLIGTNYIVDKPQFSSGAIYINKTSYFTHIDQQVWDMTIGGYQPCQRWLKDRKGMTLTNDDINHYKQMIVAIQRTIEIMDEIDRVIEL